ncbi:MULTISPECIES: RNA polymerase sigma factor [Mycobacterium]|jgi:RNA polymerase sigma-70 factor (ECF subfamily)|uniref:RNA polymerase sigma factor n=1 Tax=Mycobacterium TaxID=1763 RepID=UPI000F1BFC7B|nr:MULTISPECIES: RNA polymerase sigma factor [Mycobacterium]VAZ69682.1 ECF RNA polymerase sigma-E factor [Mycobacterium kansasii]
MVSGRTVLDDRWESEADLIAALKAGDAQAFNALVETLHAPLVRMANVYINRTMAEDAVQDAWLAVVRSIGKFEGRASIRTWVIRVVLNRVRTLARGQLDTVPYATAGSETVGHPSVDSARLAHHDLGAHYWCDVPGRWDLLPEDRLMSAEVRAVVLDGMRKLPKAQREVVSMRDIEGLSSEETCEALGISAANQRVLLHRGRAVLRTILAVLRTILEEYLHEY